MGSLVSRLDCTSCDRFTAYRVSNEDGKIYCHECGKRHSMDSTYFIYPDKKYERNEQGVLLENPP